MREGIRLQKFLSSAGVASRRHAEDLILQGAVTVNGQPAQIGDKVVPARDRVECNGKLVRAEERIYYLALNKPKGYICSRSDPQGRKSVYGLLPEELRSKVWSVGRLDFFTEGLLLFTNDGELTQALAHPRYEHEKEYEVVVNRRPGPTTRNWTACARAWISATAREPLRRNFTCATEKSISRFMKAGIGKFIECLKPWA